MQKKNDLILISLVKIIVVSQTDVVCVTKNAGNQI